MREILFRGKRIDNSKWVYGFLSKSRDVNGKLEYCIDYEEKGVMCSSIVISETVGQYTGLTDKNGKKIFDGDIIRFDENLYTVQRECDTPGGYWAETGYILKHIGWSDYTSFTSTIDDWENECQVFIIGNIHDNPKLLNDENAVKSLDKNKTASFLINRFLKVN